MVKNFSDIIGTSAVETSIDPAKIFGSLRGSSDAPRSLWHGQGEVLSKWNEIRSNSDILVSLNTGSGKTIIGLLMAQSLVNENLENVLYVCSTNDLVRQTEREASRIGIRCTTRIGRRFSNEEFPEGNAFCITNYSSIFNGHSALMTDFFPQAIIFDDAHVAEKMIRDSFTINISRNDEPELFSDISELFRSHFGQLGISGRFKDSLDPNKDFAALVAPNGLFENMDRLIGIFDKHKLEEHENLSYPYAWLKDKVHACAALFCRGTFELAPPFLPSLEIDVLKRKIRRIYLSATLESRSDIIRSFGREIEHDSIISQPEDITGNGERLIISEQKNVCEYDENFVNNLCEESRVVISVPSYKAAERWRGIASAPNKRNFSDRLQAFRNGEHHPDFKSDNKNALVLVSRVDGIDLPDDVCRIMVMDGTPSGSSMLEVYQWRFLSMIDVHRARVANRVAQMFGRIIRGNNDYGVFLVLGDDLRRWLANPRNVDFLPKLLRKQVKAGRKVAKRFIKNQSDTIEIIDQVLSRESTWLDFYDAEVSNSDADGDRLARRTEEESIAVSAALSEAKYAAEMWKGNYTNARQELESSIGTTSRNETLLGGWHAIWLGAAYELEGDADAARAEYDSAVNRLNNAVALPKRVLTDAKVDVQLSSFGRSLEKLLVNRNNNKVNQEVEDIRKTFNQIKEGTSNQAEAGTHLLGELLGFRAARPDKEIGAGPDVLWTDESKRLLLGLELKTNKGKEGNGDALVSYSKDNISQCDQQVEWMIREHPDYKVAGLVVVGPDGNVHRNATPRDEMFLCVTDSLINLGTELLALISDIRRVTPSNLIETIRRESEKEQWSMSGVFSSLDMKPMTKLIVSSDI